MSFIGKAQKALCAIAVCFAGHATAGAVSVVELTVDDVQQGYAAGEFTAVELTQTYLNRIRAFDPVYNAFISLSPDALQRAAELDAAYAAGGPVGVLHGVPVVVKDNIDRAGEITTAGFAGFTSAAGGVDVTPQQSATVVERLEAAGAIVLGKTNLPAFAADGTRNLTSFAGPTFNPYNLDLAPGASSSGTGVAVNASFAVLGLSTETSGSIQNPSAANGLVGVITSKGLVPADGVVPLDVSRDVVGPTARTVRDAAIALDVLAGPSPRDPESAGADSGIPTGGFASVLDDQSLVGTRLGTFDLGAIGFGPPRTPEAQAFFSNAVGVIESQGGEVVDATGLVLAAVGSGLAALDPSNRALTNAFELNAYFENLGPGAIFDSSQEYADLAGVDTVGDNDGFEIDLLPIASESEYNAVVDAVEAVRVQLNALIAGFLLANDLDGLVFPQISGPLPPLFSNQGYGGVYTPTDFGGGSGVTVPFEYFDDGSPFGVLFAGPQFSDGALLSYAYDFEQATLARVAPNLVPSPTAVGGGLVLVLGLAARRRRRAA
ncbi:MAG: amidase [Planctomycetota bacterium]